MPSRSWAAGQANAATLVVDEINASGGLLGRHVELLIEDSATDDAQAAAAAAKLVQDDHVDVLLGGIFSSTREAIKEPAVVEGETLYIYPEQYEGQEYHPLLFCTGAVPAQQVEPLIPWVMQQTGARTFYLPSADYIWPHVMNRKVHEVASANGGKIVGEEYFPIDHADWGETVDRINSSGADVVFNTTVPPGCVPFLEALCESGFTKRGGRDHHDVLRGEPRRRAAVRAHRGAVRVHRLLPVGERPVQQGAARPLQRALPGRPAVQRRKRVHGHVPRSQALGGRRHGSRLARPGCRRRGARPREDRRGSRAARPRWCPASTTCG